MSKTAVTQRLKRALAACAEPPCGVLNVPMIGLPFGSMGKIHAKRDDPGRVSRGEFEFWPLLKPGTYISVTAFNVNIPELGHYGDAL